MRKEFDYAREYLFSIYAEQSPLQRERNFWNYKIFVKHNLDSNKKLLESLIKLHNKNVVTY